MKTNIFLLMATAILALFMTLGTAAPVHDSPSIVRRNASDILSIDSWNSKGNADGTQLGGRIDLCQEDNYQDPCIRGFLFGDWWACYDYNGPLRSIGFQGSTRCYLYKEHGCLGFDVLVMETDPDLLHRGWGDYDTKSFSCWRPN